MSMMLIKKWIFRLLVLIFFLIILVPGDRIINIKTLAGLFVFISSGYLFLKFCKFKFESHSLLQTFVYSVITGMAVWMLALFALGSLGVKVYGWQLYVAAMVLAAVCLYTVTKDKDLAGKIRESWGNWDSIFSLTVLNLLLIVSFLPANGLLTAPLHDPAQNSIASAHLINGNFLYSSIPHFASHYPPGAAYIIAVFGSLTGIDGPKATLVLTVIMSIVGTFSLKAFGEKYFNNKKISNIIFIVSAVLFPYILGLYSLAGKNSQIFGYSFLFVSLLLFYESIKERLSLKILLGLVVAASALVHYTNIFVFASFSFVIFLIEIYTGKMKLKEIVKELLLFIIPIILILIFVILQYRNLAGLPSLTSLSTSQINPFGPLSIVNFFRYLTQPPANIFQRLNSVFPALITFVYFMILAITVYEYKNKRKVEKLNLFILLIPAAFLPLYLFGPFKVSYFSNYHVFFFATMILSYALYFVINFLSEEKFKAQRKTIKIILISVLSIYAIFAMYWLYKSNMNVRKMTAVESADLKAFEWIDKNIPEDNYFLPSAIFGFEMNQNFETDGLLYLKAYTDGEEIFGFVQGNKFAEAEEFRDEYLTLSKNLTDSEVLNTFVNEKVKYVYVDSDAPLGVEYINPEDFSNYPLVYKPVYNLEQIKIYEIIP